LGKIPSSWLFLVQIRRESMLMKSLKIKMPRDSEIFMLSCLAAPILNKRTSLFLSRRNLKEVEKSPLKIISIRGLVQLISRSTVLPIREGPWIEIQGTALWWPKFIILLNHLLSRKN
jgi:hypothetical protein